MSDSDWFANVIQQIEAEEYHITWQEEDTLLSDVPAYQAPNRAQNLRAAFTEDGFQMTSRTCGGQACTTAPWFFGLALTGYGPASDLQPVRALGQPAVKENRATYDRAALGLVEWYENTAAGLEQGFTLLSEPADMPAGDDEIVLRVLGTETPP